MGFPGSYQMGGGQVLKGVVVQRSEFAGRPLIGALSFYRRSNNCSSLPQLLLQFPNWGPELLLLQPKWGHKAGPLLPQLLWCGHEWKQLCSSKPKTSSSSELRTGVQSWKKQQWRDSKLLLLKQLAGDGGEWDYAWSLILDPKYLSLFPHLYPWSLILILVVQNKIVNIWAVYRDDRPYERSMILTLYTDPWF